jgi:preprotein translocase subunit SecA
MDRMGAEEGEVITHSMITNSIGGAQTRVELQNFEARKRLLDYDDVMNQQREVIYDLRTFALEGGEELKGEVWEMVERALPAVVEEYAPAGGDPGRWELANLRQKLLLEFGFAPDRLPLDEGANHDFQSRGELDEYLVDTARELFDEKVERFGEASDAVLRFVALSTLDEKWKDHLYDLDHLKASIGFRGWGQKDPLVEYKREAFEMFEDLMKDIDVSVARFTFRAQLAPAMPEPPMMDYFGVPNRMEGDDLEYSFEEEPMEEPAPPPPPAPRRSPMLGVNPYTAIPANQPETRTNREDETSPRPAPATAAVGRNDPCPCGSGKKYKNCHGRG